MQNRPEVPTSPDPVLSYMPQLDSLRIFAVMLVLIEHWSPMTYWFRVYPYGMSGVTLFFVLSGFLITLILLRSREITFNKNESIFHSIRQFYVRRTLRIFPVYYITIFILYIINLQNFRESFWWFFFYASNIYYYLIKEWSGPMRQMWTLSVEEQFYIVWPLIIFFIPKKYLYKTIIFTILCGPIFRTILYLFSDGTGLSSDFIHILTPSCMDCLGLGALLAYKRTYINKYFQFKNPVANIFFALSIILIVTLLFFPENVFSVFIYRFAVSFVCLIIIAKASIGFTGFLGKILENKILRYLGKISYGLYLFHTLIPLIYDGLSIPYYKNFFIKFFLQFVLLVMMASVSWYLIEKPINNLKRYFKYT